MRTGLDDPIPVDRDSPPSQLRLADGRVDLLRRRVMRRSSTVHLTTTEAALLGYLASRPNAAIDRATLLLEVWQRVDDDTRVVDAMIRKLRAKVERDPRHPEHLITEHGVGFRFLPISATPGPDLVGRGNAFDDALALLQQRWLLTVYGAGGIGKTALARALGAHHSEMIFCDLAQSKHAPEIVEVLAYELGLGPGVTPERLATALQRRTDALVVLDNVEAMAPDALAQIALWHRHVHAGIVCASRHPLGLSVEHAYELPALTPDHARELFLQRAAQHGQWAPDHGVPPALEQAIHMLDGLPLAIELAAARLLTANAEDLLSELKASVLSLERPGEKGRHGTLRATIAWSWDTCTDAQRMALAQLTPFREGFTPGAAREVIDVPGHDASTLLNALRHRSLVWGSRSPGGLRMGLYDAIRQFILEQLTPQQVQSARSEHARWFATWAGQISDGVAPVAAPRLRELRDDAANLLAAFDASGGQPRQAARIALAFSALRQHRRTPDAMLDLPVGDLTPPVAARLLLARARRQSATASEELVQHTVARAVELSEGALQAPCEQLLAETYFHRGSLSEAEASFRGAMGLATRPDQAATYVYAVGGLARIAHLKGDLEGAEALYIEALERARQIGEDASVGLNLDALAWVYLHTGRSGAAERSLFDALRAHEDRSELRFLAGTHTSLGVLHAATGRTTDALEWLQAAVDQADRYGDDFTSCIASIYLAVTLALTSEQREAHRVLDRAQTQALRQPGTPCPGMGEHARGLLLWADGDTSGARASLEMAAHAFQGSGRPDEWAVQYDRALLDLDVDQLGEEPDARTPTKRYHWQLSRASILGAALPNPFVTDPHMALRLRILDRQRSKRI